MGALGSGATFWGLGAVATDRFGAMSSGPRMAAMKSGANSGNKR